MGISDHFAHLLRNMSAGQEVKKQQLESCMEPLTGSGLRKAYIKAAYCHPYLFSFYAEHIMRNAWLNKLQAWLKIAGRNINNLRYAYDTTLMAESKEKL